MSAFQLVTFRKLDNGDLEISLTDEGRAEIADGNVRDVFDLVEHQTCNGWEWIAPEEVGALTGAEIITDDCTRDDTGKLTACGRVYSNIDYYAVESDVERIARLGSLVWRGVA